MNTACAVLLVEKDYLVLLVVTSARRQIEAFVAVNDDSDIFLTAPDFEAWSGLGIVRKLRTKGLTGDQKDALRKSFVEMQIDSLTTDFFPFEIATNKSVTDKILFSLFGKGWGVGWKNIAHSAERLIAAPSNQAFQYLVAREGAVDTARLGILYLAHKHKLDVVSQAERESNAMHAILDGAGAKPYRGGRF